MVCSIQYTLYALSMPILMYFQGIPRSHGCIPGVKWCLLRTRATFHACAVRVRDCCCVEDTQDSFAALSLHVLLQHARKRVDLKAFMRCMADEETM